MSIDEKTLLEERKVLEEDFNTTKDRIAQVEKDLNNICLLYTSPSPRDAHESRMPSSA